MCVRASLHCITLTALQVEFRRCSKLGAEVLLGVTFVMKTAPETSSSHRKMQHCIKNVAAD
jgi:hypothetical protein